MQTRHWPDHGIPCRERNISSWCRRIVAALCITALCGALSACSAPRIDGRAESEHQPSACENAYWAVDGHHERPSPYHHAISRGEAGRRAVERGGRHLHPAIRAGHDQKRPGRACGRDAGHKARWQRHLPHGLRRQPEAGSGHRPRRRHLGRHVAGRGPRRVRHGGARRAAPP